MYISPLTEPAKIYLQSKILCLEFCLEFSAYLQGTQEQTHEGLWVWVGIDIVSGSAQAASEVT